MRKNNSSTKLFEKSDDTEYFIENSFGKLLFMVNFKTSDTNSYIAFTAFSLSLDLHKSPAHFLESLAVA